MATITALPLLRPQVRPGRAYAEFLEAARTAMVAGPVAIALIHVQREHQAAVSILFGNELRNRKAVVTYGPTSLLLFIPEMTDTSAAIRLDAAIELAKSRGMGSLAAGVSCTDGQRTKTVEGLIAEADDALADARCRGASAVAWSARSASSVVTERIAVKVVPSLRRQVSS